MGDMVELLDRGHRIKNKRVTYTRILAHDIIKKPNHIMKKPHHIMINDHTRKLWLSIKKKPAAGK